MGIKRGHLLSLNPFSSFIPFLLFLLSIFCPILVKKTHKICQFQSINTFSAQFVTFSYNSAKDGCTVHESESHKRLLLPPCLDSLVLVVLQAFCLGFIPPIVSLFSVYSL